MSLVPFPQGFQLDRVLSSAEDSSRFQTEVENRLSNIEDILSEGDFVSNFRHIFAEVNFQGSRLGEVVRVCEENERSVLVRLEKLWEVIEHVGHFAENISQRVHSDMEGVRTIFNSWVSEHIPERFSSIGDNLSQLHSFVRDSLDETHRNFRHCESEFRVAGQRVLDFEQRLRTMEERLISTDGTVTELFSVIKNITTDILQLRQEFSGLVSLQGVEDFIVKFTERIQKLESHLANCPTGQPPDTPPIPDFDFLQEKLLREVDFRLQRGFQDFSSNFKGTPPNLRGPIIFGIPSEY